MKSFIRHLHGFFSDPGRVVTGLLCIAVFQYICLHGSAVWYPSIFVVSAVLVSVVWLRRLPSDKLSILAMALVLIASIHALLLTHLHGLVPEVLANPHLSFVYMTPMGVATIWVFMVAVNTRHRIMAVMLSILTATAVSAVFGLLMFIWTDELAPIHSLIGSRDDAVVYGRRVWGGRVAGLSWHPMVFGYFLATALLVASGLTLLARSRKAMMLLGLLTWLVLTAMVLSYTRAAWVGSVVGLLLLVPLLRVNRSLIIFATVLLLSLSSVIILQDIRQARYDTNKPLLYKQSHRLSLADPSFQNRSVLTEAALSDFSKQPFGSVLYQSSGIPIELDAHNQFLDVSVKLGWPGLLLVLSFYAVMLRVSWVSIRSAKTHTSRVLALTVTGTFAAYSTITMAHIFDPFTGDSFGWLLIGLVFGVYAWILSRRDSEEGRTDQGI